MKPAMQGRGRLVPGSCWLLPPYPPGTSHPRPFHELALPLTSPRQPKHPLFAVLLACFASESAFQWADELCAKALAEIVNTEAANAAMGSHLEAPRYRWLLFDADGTLFDYDRAERTAIQQALGQIGVSFNPDYLATYRRINAALWQRVEKGELTPGVVKVRRFELWLEAIQVAYSPEAFSARYLDCLANCSELLDDAGAVLEALHRKHRIAILTNGLKVVQRGRLARSVIRQHVSDIIISEEIGAAKPARAFFDTAFARLGHPSKREVLMIGDGWASDIQGAVQYGIDACWYNPGHKPRPASCEITREIASLRELNDWLG